MKRQWLLLDPAPPAGGGGTPPPAPPAPPAPGNTVTTEDLHKGIEKARMEERAKLHKDLEDANAAKLAAEQAAAQAKADAQKLQTDLEAVKKAKTADGTAIDVTKLVAEITAAAESRFKATAEEETKRLSGEVGTLRSSLSAMQLEKLRDQLVAQSGGADKLVTALIDSTSEQTLRASIAKAKEAYAEIENKVKAASGTPPQPSNANPNLNPPPPLNPQGAGGAGSGTPGSVLTEIRKVPLKEYAAVRQKALSELKSRFAAAQ